MFSDPVTLARAQFALTVMFHYLFPPLSIGLGLAMVVMEGLHLRTKDKLYDAMARFWTRIFAVNFAVGVATGIVMEFQFGLNWSAYSRYVGDVFGSALAAEGIFAFFLESGFLAILVFGWDRVSPRVHFFSTLMVFLGSVFSAVWIVVANSWQQTPAGHHVVMTEHGPRAEIVDFWAMVNNPSSMHRLVHVLLGAFILGGFFVMSVCAYYLLKRRHEAFAKRGFEIGLVIAALASIAIVFSGHRQALMVAEYQPAKLAAYEGHFKSGPAKMYLLGIPDAEMEVTSGVGVPGMLSWLVHGDRQLSVVGLDAFPKEDRPPVSVPFQTYHLMIALGVYFLALTALALVLRARGTLWKQRWLMWIFVFSVVGPYLANQAGWVAAEVGRQPWAVQGLLRTKDAVSPIVPGRNVLASVAVFSLLYAALFVIWLYVLDDKIKHGPELPEATPPEPEETRPSGLVEAAARLGDPAAPYSMTEARHSPIPKPTPGE